MIRRVLPLLLAVTLIAPATAAATSNSEKIISECANESITGTYSQKDYDKALQNLPADLAEYTDCVDVIKTAQRNAGRAGKPRATAPTAGGGGTTGGTGGTSGTPATTGATGTTAPPASTGGTTSSAPTGSTPAPATTPAPTPAPDPDAAFEAAATANQAALTAARKAGAGAVQIGGTTLSPGDPTGMALSLEDLPTPLLVLLGLFALIALLGLAALLKSWVLSIGRSRETPDPS